MRDSARGSARGARGDGATSVRALRGSGFAPHPGTRQARRTGRRGASPHWSPLALPENRRGSSTEAPRTVPARSGRANKGGCFRGGICTDVCARAGYRRPSVSSSLGPRTSQRRAARSGLARWSRGQAERSSCARALPITALRMSGSPPPWGKSDRALPEGLPRERSRPAGRPGGEDAQAGRQVGEASRRCGTVPALALRLAAELLRTSVWGDSCPFCKYRFSSFSPGSLPCQLPATGAAVCGRPGGMRVWTFNCAGKKLFSSVFLITYDGPVLFF